MVTFIKFATIVYAALLLQVAVLPAYFVDPFQPDLLVLLIVYLGLREGGWHGGVLAFLLGLVEDCFSGIYFGLSAFTFLSIYMAMRKVSDRLYTDNLYLMVLVTFLATLVNGLLQLLLLLLFSAGGTVYASILAALIPQALVNALVASVSFVLPRAGMGEETK